MLFRRNIRLKKKNHPCNFRGKEICQLEQGFLFFLVSLRTSFNLLSFSFFPSFLQSWIYQKLCYNWVLLFSVTHLSITLIPPTGLFIDSFPAISALKVTSLHCNLFPCSQTWTAQSSDTLAISSQVSVQAMTISDHVKDFWKFSPTRLEGIHLGRM